LCNESNGKLFRQAGWECEKLTAFADLVVGDTFLSAAFEAGHFFAFHAMLGTAALHPFAPHAPGGCFHLFAHQFDYIFFGYTKLHFNGIKGCPILPGHFYDAIYISRAQLIFFYQFHVFKNRSAYALFGGKDLPADRGGQEKGI
jgi:hypothetical protein